MKSPASARRALAHLNTAAVPPQVFRTRSSSGVPWNLITVEQLVAGARTSRLVLNRRQVPFAAANSMARLSADSADYIIDMAAALATSAQNPGKGPLSTALTKTKTAVNSVAMAALAQQMNAQYQAQQAQQKAQDAQKAALIAILIAAIASLIALIKHELMILDFAGALIIGLMLIDLENQLAKLVQ